MTALILQARLDSSRLPGKSMLPLGQSGFKDGACAGRPLIYRVMEALSGMPAASVFDEKILACPEDSVSVFEPLAQEAGFKLISGPKDDVLARYCIAINKSGADRVIRATGDNPFVFNDAIIALNQEALSLGADYAGYSGLPHGAGVESVLSEALLRANREASDSYERENVCPYLYNNPGLFRLHRPLAPLKWQGPAMRITVDTEEDWQRTLCLFQHLESLPPAERNLGENVIAMYKKLILP